MAKPLVMVFDVDDKGTPTLRRIKGELINLGDSVEDTTRKTEKHDNSLKKLTNTVKALAGAYAVNVIAREAIRQADAWNLVEGRLSLVTDSTEQLIDVQNKLFEISQRTRNGFEGTADLYARLARSTKDLGVNQNDLLGVTETINRTIAISGASAESAQAALFQLGQGFAAGALRGEELNSVLEQTPRLAEAIADGLGVSVGQLRKLGAEGELTAEKVLGALKSQAKAVEDEFGKVPKTVGQASTQIGNSILALVGHFDEATKATGDVSDSITALSEFIDSNRSSIVEFGLDIARGFEAAGTSAAIAALEANKLYLQIKDFFSFGDDAAREISIIDKQLELLDKDLEQTIIKIKEDTQATIANTIAKKANAEARGTDIVGKPKLAEESKVFGETEIGPSLEGQAEYLAKLEEQKNRVLQALSPTEALRARFEEQRAIIEESFLLGLTTDEERKAIIEQLEAEHQDRLTAIELKGLSDREKFERLSYREKTSFVLSEMQRMTQGVAQSNRAMFEVNKAAAIAQAAVDLPAGISKTMAAFPYPINIGMAALHGAAALSNIQQIASASFSGGGAKSLPSGAAAAPSQIPTEQFAQQPGTAESRTVNITLTGRSYSSEDVRELIEKINEETGDGAILNVRAS